LARDGAVAYAFTPMPEAFLAKEKNIRYANLALAVAPLGCHGMVCTSPHMLRAGNEAIHRLIEVLLKDIAI